MRDRGLVRSRADDSRWRNLRNTMRRLGSAEVPFARVRASYRDAATEVVADAKGHFLTYLLVDDPPGPGSFWQTADLRLIDAALAEPVEGSTRFLVPSAEADFGVISDIDDTVIRLDVARTIRMLGQVFFGNAHTRLPFPGVAPFFRALHRGVADGPPRPVFYVSSSPWKLYDVLLHFFELQGIPVGPLELREWGSPLEELRRRARHRTHKIEAIRRIFQTFPSLPFILIGDSGQQDPETYRDVIQEFPHRVLSVYIRNLQRDPMRESAIQELAAEVEAAGSSLVLADDTLAAARHAASHGWIASRTLEEIASDSHFGRWRATAHQRARTAIVDEKS